MRRMIFMLAVPALMLSGCAHVATTPATLPAIAATVELDATKGLIVAEQAYQSAVTVTMALVQQGMVRGETAGRIRKLNQQANQALDRAHAARDQVARAAAVADAMNAIADVMAIAQPEKK